MNIILAESNTGGGQASEKEFNQGVITIGRDANECDVAYDSARFPMVSRKHAEIRWHDNRWFLVDLNSSYGTYLNGQRIAQPQPIAVGSQIQFGMDGPALTVSWFQVVSETFQQVPQQVHQQVAVQQPAAVPISKPVATPVSLPSAQLDFNGSPLRPPLKILKSSILARTREGM
jgi:pSer/pThr/pTyr-binding forkhead associated (FHA) protein